MSVQGYQAVVPLYLNGCPQNMVNSKMVSVKQKIITLNKSVSYSAYTTTRQIEDESVKAMQIVKRLESQGYRCNLNIVLGVFKGTRRFIVKIRIKNANEKLNVSKLAFPMVHPSMLRCLFFRFIEVYPKVTSVFSYGYGHPIKGGALREFLDKIEFKKTGAQFTYVRKYYKGYVIVEGCYVYFNKKDYKPYEIREVYSTSGKRRTANGENGSLPKVATKKVVKVEKPKEPKKEETKQVKHEKYDVIKCCLENSIPVYLAGPAGSGKNYTVEQIAKELEWNFYFSNSVQQEYKLTGFIDAGGKYHETESYKACKEASEGKMWFSS